MSEEEEQHWIRECLAGRSDAFAPIVERYQRMVRSMVARLVGDEHQVEELAHQTFISAFESLDKYNGSSRFSTWLGQIALNKARDHLRSRTRRERGKLDFEGFDAPDETPGLEAAVQGKQNAALLGQALESLPEASREVIVLRYLHEHDYKEIGEQTGCTESTAKVRCWRAVMVLRRELERLGAEL